MPILICSKPSETCCQTVLVPSRLSRLWSTLAICTVSPISMVPESGCSLPVSMRNRVDLPAPLPPITPTMAPFGMLRDRLSISTRSP
ncbi:hypothetical protein D3C84_1078610 [compost metagenome]